MELNITYFYTVAIVDWIHLLEPDRFKTLVLDSLSWLAVNKKVKIYGFVIMPNHIHIVWENIALNSKEMPYVSFMKFTGHAFLKELRTLDPQLLKRFEILTNDRQHQFWQKNALPKIVGNAKVMEQKLDYMHLNPLQSHWNLVTDPNEYNFSSCSFYEQDDKRFDWLTDYRDNY